MMHPSSLVGRRLLTSGRHHLLSRPILISKTRLPFTITTCDGGAPKRAQSTTTTTTNEPLVRPLSPSVLFADDAAEILHTRFAGKVFENKEVLDGKQLRKLALTLRRRELHPGLDVSTRIPPDGTPIPPGYHYIYFTPDGVEGTAGDPSFVQELGTDGSDLMFSAPAPFTRKTSAGGRIKWPLKWEQGESELRVGDEVTERTVFVGATPQKIIGNGGRPIGEMLLVRFQKEFWGPRGLAFTEERSWRFQPKQKPHTQYAPPPLDSRIDMRLHSAGNLELSLMRDVKRDSGIGRLSVYPQRVHRWSSLALFRFSALTFNGHKIHYDPVWSATMEGQPGVVVQAPLNVICMLDYWRDHCAHEGYSLQEMSYRVVGPIHAGETYDLVAFTPDVTTLTPTQRLWGMNVRSKGNLRLACEIMAEKEGGEEKSVEEGVAGGVEDKVEE